MHSGLCRMYEAEVWGKRPVIQHYLFGDVIRFEKTPTDSSAAQQA